MMDKFEMWLDTVTTERRDREIDAETARGLAVYMPEGRRHTAIVAHAHVGVMAYVFSQYFEHVIALEPDEENFKLVLQNLSKTADYGNIRTGQSIMQPDLLAFRGVDLIVATKDVVHLDKATDTIYKHRPVVASEKDLHRDWLLAHEYRRVYRINDFIMYAHNEDYAV